MAVNTSGEVFPNAPLSLVAAEVRYPPVSDRQLGMAIHRQIRDLIGSDWVIHNDTSQTFEAVIGPEGPSQATMRSDTIGRIVNRQKTKIITVQPDRLVVEVSDYLHFESFRELLVLASQAVDSVLRPDGISRVGLRYIDEITVPQQPPKWDEWLHGSLMAPSDPPSLVPAEWTGAVQYRLGEDQVVVFRYGPSMGSVISANIPLRRVRVPVGPIFMLDFDSSWQPVDIPQFSAPKIAASANKLRAPLRGLFDHAVTPQLLEIFRQEA